MNSVWKAIFFGLLVTTEVCTGLTAIADHSRPVLDYISSLIRYLADQEPGSFDCWFYEASKQSVEHTSLNAIVTSERLNLIPKRILYSEGKVEVHRSPGVLVIFVNAKQCHTIELFLTSSFDRGMKIVALYSYKNHEGLINIQQTLRAMQLHNSAYICTDVLMIHNMEAFQTQTFTRNGAVQFPEVFIDPTNNLTGRTFHLSLSNSALWNTDAFNGYATELFPTTIERFGGRYQFHFFDCKEVKSVKDCLMKSVNYNSTTTYDFGLNTLSNTIMINEICLHSIVPITIQIAAPSGQKLTLINLFVLPFRSELWIFLLALILFCVMLMIVLPHRFKNNLILLPLCGFERNAFHQVTSLEKTVLAVLTVIYFVLATAYEAKISAFLADYPYKSDP